MMIKKEYQDQHNLSSLMHFISAVIPFIVQMQMQTLTPEAPGRSR